MKSSVTELGLSLVIAELYNTCSFPENGKAINIAVFKVVSFCFGKPLKQNCKM